MRVEMIRSSVLRNRYTAARRIAHIAKHARAHREISNFQLHSNYGAQSRVLHNCNAMLSRCAYRVIRLEVGYSRKRKLLAGKIESAWKFARPRYSAF